MAPGSIGFFIFVQIVALNLYQIPAFPTPEATEETTVYNRLLSEERPLQEQIAEAESVTKKEPIASKQESELPELNMELDNDDFRLLKSLAERSQGTNNETVNVERPDVQSVADDTDSTKNRRLAEDYDSTKSGGEYKYPDGPESFHQVDGTPLTAEDIVQKIAAKIYEEDDRGVFDRIVSKLLKLGLITDSQADTLEYEVAEALQELITKNARDNEVDDLGADYPAPRGSAGQREQNPDANMELVENPSRKHKMEQGGVGGNDTVDRAWVTPSEENHRGEQSPEDGLQDLQYFPNFYSLLKSLNSEKDAEERETLITIMKTLIDFVKMMVKYGTITPEEGVAYLEHLDAMIAIQTKNKLGKSLETVDFKLALGKTSDEVDNTKDEAAKMQQEYESLKDTTNSDQAVTETGHNGKSNTYLEAIRKNIEWLKKHNKDGDKEEYDLSKLRNFMNQEVDSYIDCGILPKDEGEVIKRIYGSL
ncbi:secretogranin-3-like [Megalops cyprinoides]|uniref:secretogranin-3-like n=1 Tax=Megalops cyprinoides TaxID=118141 RepID=UPI0018650357|nr:secretogranin-3-like [Megalops cyprinoides]